MDSLTSFLSHSVPAYKDLFKVRHSENQALLLFENYLCYRALLDILSLRSSRWEQLVNVVFLHVKDDIDEECKRWLCCMHLGVLIREAILNSNYENYCNVLKCFKMNGALFPKKAVHKKLTNQLNVSIACYCLIVEKDKVKAAEACDTDNTVLELISAFPDFSINQNEFMYSQAPHTALIKILDNLRCAVMKMPPPVLVEMFDEYLRAVQEQDNATNNTTVPADTEKQRGTTPLSSTDSSSAIPPVDEPSKTSGPQTRAKTAAAQHDGKNTEVAVNVVQLVPKSPRKPVSTTDDKTDDATDGGKCKAGPKTIHYSLRGTTERQPKSPAAKLKSPKKKLQSTPTKLQATPTKSPSSKSQATPSKPLPAPSNTRVTPSRSYTPTKPRPASPKSPSKLTTHVASEVPVPLVVAVVMGSDAEDDNVVTPQSTPHKRKAIILESSSDSGEAEQPSSTVQPTSTVQQSEDAKKKVSRRGLRDLKETAEVPNSWSSSSSSDESYFTALPRGMKIKHRRRESLEVSPQPKKFRFSSAIRHPWTDYEAKLLVEGVEKFGLGHWSAILQQYKFPAYRDNVSLKDKWRNMKKNHEVPDKFL